MRTLLLLCSLFISSSLHTMYKLSDQQLQSLVKQMTEENRSILPDDGIRKRLARNTAICMAEPLDFLYIKDRNDHRQLLLNYVMRELTIDGNDINKYDDKEKLKEAYKKIREKQIDAYIDKRSKDVLLMTLCCGGTVICGYVDKSCGPKLPEIISSVPVRLLESISSVPCAMITTFCSLVSCYTCVQCCVT